MSRRACTQCGKTDDEGAEFYVYPNGRVLAMCRDCDAARKRKYTRERTFRAAVARGYS